MNNRTLTSANSILLLSVDPIFPIPIRLQGFSADDVTSIDALEPTETSMGIDGRLSAGYVPVPVSQNITLQADSESNDFFDFWANYERQAKEKVVASGTIILPGTQAQYVLFRGFLRGYAPLPDVKRTLQPRRFTVVWERITPAPRI